MGCDRARQPCPTAGRHWWSAKWCAGLGDDKGDVAPNAERYEPSYLFDTPRGVAGFAWENLWERMLAGYRAADSRVGPYASAALSTVPGAAW